MGLGEIFRSTPWLSALVFFIVSRFVTLSFQRKTTGPGDRLTHYLVDMFCASIIIRNFKNNFIMHMHNYLVTCLVKAKHGISKAIPGNSLDNILYQLTPVSILPAPLLCRLVHSFI